MWCDLPEEHRFRPLKQLCDARADEFEAKTAMRQVDLDPVLARDAMALLRNPAARTTDRHVRLCTNLHAGIDIPCVISNHREFEKFVC